MPISIYAHNNHQISVFNYLPSDTNILNFEDTDRENVHFFIDYLLIGFNIRIIMCFICVFSYLLIHFLFNIFKKTNEKRSLGVCVLNCALICICWALERVTRRRTILVKRFFPLDFFFLNISFGFVFSFRLSKFELFMP